LWVLGTLVYGVLYCLANSWFPGSYWRSAHSRCQRKTRAKTINKRGAVLGLHPSYFVTQTVGLRRCSAHPPLPRLDRFQLRHVQSSYRSNAHRHRCRYPFSIPSHARPTRRSTSSLRQLVMRSRSCLTEPSQHGRQRLQHPMRLELKPIRSILYLQRMWCSSNQNLRMVSHCLSRYQSDTGLITSVANVWFRQSSCQLTPQYHEFHG